MSHVNSYTTDRTRAEIKENGPWKICFFRIIMKGGANVRRFVDAQSTRESPVYRKLVSIVHRNEGNIAKMNDPVQLQKQNRLVYQIFLPNTIIKYL
jgi:hypothetical protein